MPIRFSPYAAQRHSLVPVLAVARKEFFLVLPVSPWTCSLQVSFGGREIPRSGSIGSCAANSYSSQATRGWVSSLRFACQNAMRTGPDGSHFLAESPHSQI